MIIKRIRKTENITKMETNVMIKENLTTCFLFTLKQFKKII